MTVTLSTAYFPPIEWLSYVVQSGDWALEAHEHFPKAKFSIKNAYSWAKWGPIPFCAHRPQH